MKYRFLLLLTPLILAETVVQANYFLRLSPDIITSCCGTLFSGESETLSSEMSALPSIPMKVLFYLTMVSTAASGAYYYWKDKGGYLISSLSIFAFLVSMLSILSFISVHFYELPTHHCPFCMLQKEYGYVGYPLYLTLLGGTLSGTGVGLLMPFKEIESLSTIIPSLQRRLALASVVLFIAFAAIATYPIVFTDFILEGY